MKSFNLFLAFSLLVFTNTTFAQSISISESTELFREGKLNVILVNIPFVDTRIVELQLRDEMRDWNGKASVSKGEFMVDKGSIKTLGNEEFDAVAKVVSEKDKVVQIALAVKLSDAYLSSAAHPVKFEAMSGRMQIFAMRCSKLGIADREVEAERELLSIERDKKVLENRKNSLEESIVNYERRIKEAKEKIELNIAEQKEIDATLVKQKAVVADIKKKKESLQD